MKYRHTELSESIVITRKLWVKWKYCPQQFLYTKEIRLLEAHISGLLTEFRRVCSVWWHTTKSLVFMMWERVMGVCKRVLGFLYWLDHIKIPGKFMDCLLLCSCVSSILSANQTKIKARTLAWKHEGLYEQLFSMSQWINRRDVTSLSIREKSSELKYCIHVLPKHAIKWISDSISVSFSFSFVGKTKTKHSLIFYTAYLLQGSWSQSHLNTGASGACYRQVGNPLQGQHRD